MASATASPTAAAAAISATVTAAAAISATVTAAAVILAGTIATAAGGIALRGIVMRREILRCGSVGIRLAFFTRFGMLLFHGSRRNCFVMFLEWLPPNGGRVIVRSVRLFRDMGFALA